MSHMTDLVEAVPEIFLERGPRDVIVERIPKIYRPEGYDPAQIGLTSINQLIYLIRASAAESAKAVSWRDYRVGAAAVSFNFDTHVTSVMTGSNVKPEENGGLNLHAEQISLAKVRRFQLGEVIAMAVWGDPTDLDANPNQEPTLRFCRRCSDMFDSAPEITDKTILLSGNRDFSKCELYTADELGDYYKDPGAVGLISDTPPFSLADDMDDDRYTQEVLVPYFLPKIASLYPDSPFGRSFLGR